MKCDPPLNSHVPCSVDAEPAFACDGASQRTASGSVLPGRSFSIWPNHFCGLPLSTCVRR